MIAKEKRTVCTIRANSELNSNINNNNSSITAAAPLPHNNKCLVMIPTHNSLEDERSSRKLVQNEQIKETNVQILSYFIYVKVEVYNRVNFSLYTNDIFIYNWCFMSK